MIYYNEQAAVGLGRVWADLYNPNVRGFAFPEGSIVVKAEAATYARAMAGADGGLDLEGLSPAGHDDNDEPTAEVLTLHPVQISVRIKDSTASPVTGWVFTAFVYDRDAPGATCC